MFQRIIDDFKESTGTALRLASLAGIAVLALLITASFLCAAGFRLRAAELRPGPGLPDRSCGFLCRDADRSQLLHGAESRVKARAAEAARSAAHSPLADPMLIATGLQLVRAIGLKKLIPLLALGGLALGMLASRNTPSDDDPENLSVPNSGHAAAGLRAAWPLRSIR